MVCPTALVAVTRQEMSVPGPLGAVGRGAGPVGRDARDEDLELAADIGGDRRVGRRRRARGRRVGPHVAALRPGGAAAKLAQRIACRGRCPAITRSSDHRPGRLVGTSWMMRGSGSVVAAGAPAPWAPTRPEVTLSKVPEFVASMTVTVDLRARPTVVGEVAATLEPVKRRALDWDAVERAPGVLWRRARRNLSSASGFFCCLCGTDSPDQVHRRARLSRRPLAARRASRRAVVGWGVVAADGES